MDERILVACEADVPDLSGLFGRDCRMNGALCREDAVGIVEPEHLMEHPQVKMIGLQPLERLVELRLRNVLVPAIHLGHQEDLVAVSALGQCFPHADLAVAFIVVPGVIHERDAAIDRSVAEAR